MCIYDLTLNRYCGHVDITVRDRCEHSLAVVPTTDSAADSAIHGDATISACDQATGFQRSAAHRGCRRCEDMPALKATFALRAAMEKEKGGPITTAEKEGEGEGGEEQGHRAWMGHWFQAGYRLDVNLMRATRNVKQGATWRGVIPYYCAVQVAARKLYWRRLRERQDGRGWTLGTSAGDGDEPRGPQDSPSGDGFEDPGDEDEDGDGDGDGASAGLPGRFRRPVPPSGRRSRTGGTPTTPTTPQSSLRNEEEEDN